MLNARIVIFSLVFIFSCTKEIKIQIPSEGTIIVVNCLFHPNFILPYPKPNYIEISQSTEIFDSTRKKIVNNAIVLITSEDNAVDTFKYIDSLKLYESLKFNPVNKKKYNLKVTVDGFNLVESSDLLPTPVKISDYSLIKYAGRDEEGEIFSEITVTFKDPGEEINFYEVQLTDYRIFSNDPVITSENYYPSILSFGAKYPKSLPFNDEMINGETYNLKIFYFFPMSTNKDSIETHTIFLHLNSISYNYYKYKTTLISHLYRKESDILYGQGEPLNVYTNIENGYGIFAGYNYDIITIVVRGEGI